MARFTSFRRLGAACATTAAIALVAVACGADSNSAPTTAPLSEAAQRGQSIMSTNGCAACHGTDWNGGAGPALIGLYNTERTLDDGTVVLADDEYLITAIAEPTA
ncbi:MAG: cytochrome c, partial [Actinomycetota bacterium]